MLEWKLGEFEGVILSTIKRKRSQERGQKETDQKERKHQAQQLTLLSQTNNLRRRLTANVILAHFLHQSGSAHT